MRKQFKKLCLVMALGAAIGTQAQQTWYFGTGAGIQFPTPATLITSAPALNSGEGTSVLVDGSNKVMMYSDGINVWNGNHTLQFNGLLGDPSTSQGVQIVPIPSSSPAMAFVFTLPAMETNCYGNANNTSGLRATLVQITGAAPATAVSVVPGNLNIRLTDGLNLMSERMAVTPDGRGGYWVVVHGIGVFDGSPYSGGTPYWTGDQDKFYAYNVKCGQKAVTSSTLTDLNSTEKKSTISNSAISLHQSWSHPSGNSYNMSGSPQFNSQGQMKIVKTSSTAAKLACTLAWAGNASGTTGYIVNPSAQLYNMNLVTGAIDNASAKQFLLGFNHTNTTDKDGTAYGVEFSPNGNYLYVSSTHGSGGFGDMTSRIYQVDLTTSSYTSAVVASLPHANADGFGALQLGPDNKIYVARPGKSFLDIIGSPNNHATAGIGYTTGMTILGTCKSGLPGPVLNINTAPVPSLTVPAVYCAGQIITATGGYSGQIPANQFWEIYGSDASGNPVNSAGVVVAGGPSASWYDTQTWVDDVPGTFTFPGGTTLPCNKYYSIKLALTDGCGSWNEITKTFYLQCYPTPVITSSVPNPVCYGTTINLCVNYTPATGVVVDWANNFYNYPSPADNIACISTLPNQNVVYTAGVSLKGCRSITTYSVIEEQNNPDFGLAGNLPSGSSPYYNITATPVISPPAGVSYYWEVVQLDASNNEVALTKAQNWGTCWWTGGATNFLDYDYTQAYGGTPCATGVNPGKFQTDKKYKVTYGTWSNNCPWQSKSLTIEIGHGKNIADLFVIQEVAASEAPQTVTGVSIITGSEATLVVSPNPSNGIFQLECSDKTEKSIRVYDVMGKSVYSKTKVTESLITIDLENQSKGIYFIDIISNGKKISKKIIIQ